MDIFGNVAEQLHPVESGGYRPSTRQADSPTKPIVASPADMRNDERELFEHRPSCLSLTSAESDRVAEIRRKVYEGAYNSLDLVDQVARRLLQSGDF